MKIFLFVFAIFFFGSSWAGYMKHEAFSDAKAPVRAEASSNTLMQSERSPFALTVPEDDYSPLRLAHAILVKSIPDKNAVISDAPEDVLLIFNDKVGEEHLALAVIDEETGKRVDRHDAKLDFSDRSHLRASVQKLNPGRYAVRYRVLSADGHIVSGKYFFKVDAKPH